MRALSIRQPWAWAILHAGKRVENRSWKAIPMIGQTFLLHASGGCTIYEYTDAIASMWEAGALSKQMAPPSLTSPALPRGAIVGRARLDEVVRTTEQGHRQYLMPRMHCVCGAVPGFLGGDRWAHPCSKADPWAVMGALGLLLADVERLVVPVPFKGALGFFEVPDALLAGATWEPCP